MGRRQAFAECAALVAIFGAAVAAIDPRGNFPLNDDGYYALPAFAFARSGEFHLTGGSTSMRAQVVWGALFVRLFGESYDVLRMSTLILAAATIVLVNRLLARTPIAPSLRFVASLALGFNPLFLTSSCTFMTEVPYVFASAVSLYCYVRALESGRAAWFVAGAMATALSWWIRQTGILNALPPLALLVVYRNQIAARWRRDVALCLAPVAVFAVIFVTRREWLTGSIEEFQGLYRMWSESTFRLPQQFALVDHYVTYTLQNSALFYLPLTIAALFLLPRATRRFDRIFLGAAALVTTLTAWEVVRHGIPMPYYAHQWCCDLLEGNIFMNFGLGQPTLADVWSLGYDYPFAIGFPSRVVLTFAASLLAALVLWLVLATVRARWRDPRGSVVVLMAAAHATISIAALCVSAAYLDRYAIDAAWALVIVMAAAVPWTRVSRRVATAALVFIAVFGVLSLQEYFAWNRARWNAYWELRRDGAPLREIDGGAEAYNTFEVAYVLDLHARRRMAFSSGPRRYVLAFHALPGCRVLHVHPFTSWLGTRRAAIYALQRM